MKIVTAVKRHPEPYKRSDKRYFDLPLKDDLWEKIACEIGGNPDPVEVRQIWNQLSNNFLKRWKDNGSVVDEEPSEDEFIASSSSVSFGLTDSSEDEVYEDEYESAQSSGDDAERS